MPDLTAKAPLFLGWLCAGVVELLLCAGTVDPPTGTEVGVELVAVTLVGAAHAFWAPLDWRGSVAWPGAALIAAVLLRIGTLPLLWEAGRIAFVAAALVMGVRVFDDLVARLPRALAAIGLVLLAGLSGRFTRLLTAPVAQPHIRLGEELRAPFSAGAPAPVAGPPVIVISVDTLRSDRAVGMATWQRLADRGATWERALASSSWTVPSLATLWTGATPARHGAGNLPDGSGFSAISPDLPHLAEQLSAQGYDTAAFVANPFVARELGLGRGFRTWVNSDERPGHPLIFAGHRNGPRGRDGQRVVARALSWLQTAPDTGFLMWVHLFDPHVPYRHSTDPLASAVTEPTHIRDGSLDSSPQRQAAVTAAYDNEVAYADAALMPLLDALETRGLLDTAVVVFTSDHGEELWDHDGFEHGHSHHAEVVDVPLALLAPGLASGPRTGVASLQDIATTVRAATSLSTVAHTDGALDLREQIPAGRIATAAGNLYGPVQQSARSPRRKVIVTLADEGEQIAVFDPSVDPTELAPLSMDESAEELEAARGALPAAGGAAAQLNEQALRALGYLD